MIQKSQIPELVNLFKERMVLLYHSAQFVDFQSYVQLGGIPSRAMLATTGLPFTRFETDQNDHTNQVWDKVFLNPLDFGEIFQKGRCGVPTVYGPITFVFNPEALLEAEDVAVSLRSAGCPDFDRVKESLSSIDQIEKIFKYEKLPSTPLWSEVRFTDELKQAFGLTYASNPEINLTIPGCPLSFSHLNKIIVDAYRFKGIYLKEMVRRLAEGMDFKPRLVSRSLQPTSFKIADQILHLLENDNPTLDKVCSNPDTPAELREWALKLQKKPGMADQWRRFATYFRNGTILPILEAEKV